jgi:hypothetical protein
MAKQKSMKPRPAATKRLSADVRVRVVEAGEFRLVDRAGRTRAALEMTRNGPRLAMMHECGTVALELTLASDGPSVRLSDGEDATRVFLGATRGAARMGMADGKGSQRLFFGVSAEGTPTITLYDREQGQVWTTPPARTRVGKPGKS